MIQLDTSTLVDALTGKRHLEPRLRQFIEASERVHISAPVLFEWRRGPRKPEEIEDQEILFPTEQIIPFGSSEALFAAALYRKLRRARGRETDITIAACALAHNARLWTLNPDDFKDIPGLLIV
jgi:predicted nucleic acid-binding protein